MGLVCGERSKVPGYFHINAPLDLTADIALFCIIFGMVVIKQVVHHKTYAQVFCGMPPQPCIKTQVAWNIPTGNTINIVECRIEFQVPGQTEIGTEIKLIFRITALPLLIPVCCQVGIELQFKPGIACNQFPVVLLLSR